VRTSSQLFMLFPQFLGWICTDHFQ